MTSDSLILLVVVSVMVAFPLWGVVSAIRTEGARWKAVDQHRLTWVVLQIVLPPIGTAAYAGSVRPRLLAVDASTLPDPAPGNEAEADGEAPPEPDGETASTDEPSTALVSSAQARPGDGAADPVDAPSTTELTSSVLTELDPTATGRPGAPGRPTLLERTQRTVVLLRILAPREVRLKYRENVLEVGWALLTPIAIMAVYGVVLTQSFDVTGSCAPYLSTAWTGLVPWTFFATGIGAAVWSLVAATELLSKIYFPRESIPLSVVGAALIDLALALATVFGVALFQGVHIHLTVLGMIPALTLLIVWTTALGVIVSAVAVFIRDTTQIVQLGIRVGFFATPVMYEPDLLPDAFKWSASVNPLAVAITGIRDSLLCGTWPKWGLMTIQLTVGVVLLVLSVMYMRSVESRMTDVL